MLTLTRDEIMRISQIVISSGHETIKFSKNVMAFTEQGVAMLSSVLNSKRAVQVNIAIMTGIRKIERNDSFQIKNCTRRLDKLEE